MGKLQNKVLQLLGVIVVISAIACQAYQQQQHSSDSDYSENLSRQHPQPAVHRHHKHHQHQQHRLNSVSLGHRNSSRFSLITGSATGNHYQPQQQTHNYHHNHNQHPVQAGNTAVHQQPQQWYHRTPRTQSTVLTRRDNGVRNPTGVSQSGQAGNTAFGVRPVKRMLKHNNHHGHHRNVTGTNVCTEKRTVHVPVYRKSTVKHFVQPCLDQKLCSGVRTNYEPTYQTVKREVYVCCAGWETETTIADGCLKPICRSSCRNGGRCTAPDTCSCPAGFSGPQCAEDINECKQSKPCDQTCYNTDGSYYCTCREGFQLQADRQSCKRMVESNDVASEARDMENDVDYDSLDTRLSKLEKIILHEDRARSQSETHELSKKVQYALDAVSSLRSQVSRLTQRLYPVVDYGNRIN